MLKTFHFLTFQFLFPIVGLASAFPIKLDATVADKTARDNTDILKNLIMIAS